MNNRVDESLEMDTCTFGSVVPLLPHNGERKTYSRHDILALDSQERGRVPPEFDRELLKDKYKTLEDKLYSQITLILTPTCSETASSTKTDSSSWDDKGKQILQILTSNHIETGIKILTKVVFRRVSWSSGNLRFIPDLAKMVKSISAQLQKEDGILFRKGFLDYYQKECQGQNKTELRILMEREWYIDPPMWRLLHSLGTVHFLGELYLERLITTPRTILDYLDYLELAEMAGVGGEDEQSLYCLATVLLIAGERLEEQFNQLHSGMEEQQQRVPGKWDPDPMRISRIYQNIKMISKDARTSHFMKEILSELCDLRDGGWGETKQKRILMTFFHDGPKRYLQTLKLKKKAKENQYQAYGYGNIPSDVPSFNYLPAADYLAMSAGTSSSTIRPPQEKKLFQFQWADIQDKMSSPNHQYTSKGALEDKESPNQEEMDQGDTIGEGGEDASRIKIVSIPPYSTSLESCGRNNGTPPSPGTSSSSCTTSESNSTTLFSTAALEDEEESGVSMTSHFVPINYSSTYPVRIPSTTLNAPNTGDAANTFLATNIPTHAGGSISESEQISSYSSSIFSLFTSRYLPPQKKARSESSSTSQAPSTILPVTLESEPSASAFVPSSPGSGSQSRPCTCSSQPIPPSVNTRIHPFGNTPIPPNWEYSYRTALQTLTPYSTSPVPNTSMEYHVLSSLIEPAVQIMQINRVVNTELWRRFVSTRRDLLSSKSSNLELLQSLGLPEDEILHRTHVNVNFSPDPTLMGVEYSDNMALLFHCTKQPGNVENILTQGLDERLGHGGSFGKGIYFADDPAKSIAYDGNGTLLVFGVLLGDCIRDASGQVKTLQREPKKTKPQMRNHMDLFFDSLVGRARGLGSNEFVIFNRNQCCPLYSITYIKPLFPEVLAYKASNLHQQQVYNVVTKTYSSARTTLPPFAWVIQPGQTEATPQRNPSAWPFHARIIFGSMVGSGDEGESPNPFSVTLPPPPTRVSLNSFQVRVTESKKLDVYNHNPKSVSKEAKLNALHDLGFWDDGLNMSLLEACDYNLDTTVMCLVDGAVARSGVAGNAAENQLPQVTSSTSTSGKSKSHWESFPDPADVCQICYNDYPPGQGSWKTLTCNHKLCHACYSSIQSTGRTMGGVECTNVKCPFCLASTAGAEIGSCPDGTMDVDNIPTSLPGYGEYSTFQITYRVPGRYRLRRVAYIPNCEEGRKVVNLLRLAWDQRLVFSIGTSSTTGTENTLIWNIHHKTSISGGVEMHGYPDPSYLTRVREELAQFGIK